MGKFLKFLEVSLWILLSIPILIVVFIIMGLGIVIVHEKIAEKNQTNHNITQHVYSDGRKTIESFGTRREFAILRFSLDKDKQTALKKSRWSLYNRDNDQSIDCDIKCYKKIVKYVYATGEKGYTKLNYETGEIIQSKNINDFSQEDQEIFNSLEKK